MKLERDLSELKALVIDDMGAMRNSLKAQLNQLRITDVDTASNPEDALDRVRSAKYDVILCDYNLNRASTGQQFLEFLRSQDILPAHTLFLMVTAEADYDAVASVSEFQPDDYLLKPFTSDSLRARLKRLLDKQGALQPIMNCLNSKDPAKAVQECDKLLETKWAIEAYRQKAAILLEMGRHAEAKAAYEAVLLQREDLAWAKLGLAKCHLASGNPGQANAIATELLEKNGNFIAVYDVLAEIAEKQEDKAAALDILKQASAVIPSPRRHRIVAEVAYQANDLETAKATYERVIKHTRGSMTEQSTDFLSLAQAHVDAGEPDKALQVLDTGTKSFGDTGVFAQVKASVKAQAHAALGEPELARKSLERARNLIRDPQGDLATVTMAKACLALGDHEEGLKLLSLAVRADEKNRKIVGFARKALVDSGLEAHIEDIVDPAKKEILAIVSEAAALMRKARFSEAFEKLKEAFDRAPDHVETLMAAAQLNLLWMSQNGYDEAYAQKASSYLDALDRLVPGNERAANFRRFLGELASRA